MDRNQSSNNTSKRSLERDEILALIDAYLVTVDIVTKPFKEMPPYESGAAILSELCTSMSDALEMARDWMMNESVTGDNEYQLSDNFLEAILGDDEDL